MHRLLAWRSMVPQGVRKNSKKVAVNKLKTLGKLIVAKTETTGNNLEILALDETQPTELIEKRRGARRAPRRGTQKAEAIDASGFLRRRCSRPNRRRAANKCNEVAPSHTPHGFRMRHCNYSNSKLGRLRKAGQMKYLWGAHMSGSGQTEKVSV